MGYRIRLMVNTIKTWLIRICRKFPSKLFAKVLAGLFVFYLLFSYFAVNPIAKELIPNLVEKSLASKASVGSVEFDPFRLKTTINNFQLSNKNGELLASFEKLIVDLELSGMFDLAWKFKQVGVVAPQVNVAVASNGELNWDALVAKLNEDKAPPSDTIPRLVIEHIIVSQGKVQYADASSGKLINATLAPLGFKLKGFSTLPKDRGDYLISAAFAENGGSLKWKGDMGVNPVASKGVIALDGVKIAKILQLVKGLELPLQLNAGDAQASFNYDFLITKTIPKLTLNNMTFSLSDVAAELAQGRSLSLTHAVLSAPRLDFVGNKQSELHIKDLDFKLLELSLRQGDQGQVTLKESTASLPQLHFSMQEQAQVLFNDLNLKFADLNVNKGEQVLLALPSVDVNAVSLDLAANSATINQIVLPAGKVSAIRDRAGNVNWQQLFVSADQSPTTEVEAVVNEESQPYQKKLAESAAPIEELQTEQGLQAEQAAPNKQAMAFDIADIQLKNWTIAFQDQSFKQPLSIDVADFNLGFSLVAPQGNVEINKLESSMTGITTKAAQVSAPVVTLEQLTLTQGAVSVAEQKVTVQALVFSGFKTSVIKNADASLNWLSILEPAEASTISTESSKKSNKGSSQPEWSVGLKKIALAGANIHIQDKSVATPVVMDIVKANIEVQDVSLDITKPLPVKAAFRVKQGGRFTTKGQLWPSPLKVKLGLRLSGLSLKPFAPYVNQFAFLKLDNGAASVSGQLNLKQNQNLSMAFNGKFGVKQLALLEEVGGAPFLSWDNLSSDNLKVSLMPNKLQMGTLQVVKPEGKFIINEDKSMNVTRVLRNQATSAQPTSQRAIKVVAPPAPVSSDSLIQPTIAPQPPEVTVKKTAAEPTAVSEQASTKEVFPVSIDTVRVSDAKLEFADLSLTPQFGTNIHSLNGVINGLSTKAAKVSQVEMDGKVDEYGAARIRGSLQPFNATEFTDIKLAFTNLDMSRLTPYSGKFAGRRIDSGKLSVELEYKIKQNQLAGENKFVINKIKLGEKVDSADAADLPLDLAIAILEDSDGLIDLDLPISGSLDDPKFSYGSIFWKAIRNVIKKIVTAPFRALGKIFGDGAEDFDGIAFEGGIAEIAPPELEKLAKVSKALSKRQGLSLGIVPSYDVALDTLAMQEASYRFQVSEEMDVELAEGQFPGPVDLANENTQKAVRSLHDDLTKKGIFKKLVSKFKKPEDGYYEKAQKSLIASVEVTGDDLQALAKSRGEAIQKILIDAGIDTDRVSIEKPVKTMAKEKVVKTKLTLDVKKSTSPAADIPKVVAPADPLAAEKPVVEVPAAN